MYDVFRSRPLKKCIWMVFNGSVICCSSQQSQELNRTTMAAIKLRAVEAAAWRKLRVNQGATN